MKAERQRLFSLAAVVVAAVLFGMVIAGGLDITPGIDAQKPAEVQGAEVQLAPAGSATGLPDFAALAEQVVPSVVSVFNTDVEEPGEGQRGMPSDPFHFFFGPREGEEEGEPTVRRSSGSGFFISSAGEVLTNYHVVQDADRIEIELADGSRYEVKVVGRDPETDLALLQVEQAGTEFPALRLGRSETARVGEWVMAVGNPLNMEHTVTVGVVSAKERVLGLTEDRSFESFIQTDAAINFGNSGGPLVNLRGEVIGINTAINVRGQNLGFAVPVDVATRILPQLRSSGKVVRGYLGAMVRNVDQKMQEAFGLDTREGAFVDNVLPGHAADRAGLEPGDVVISIDGRRVKDTRDLIDDVSSKAPGTKVHLEVIREGRTQKLTVELEQRQGSGEEAEETSDEVTGDRELEERVGIAVSELTPRMRQIYGVDDSIDGVVISRVKAVSPAGEEGLLRGDVITKANGNEVRTVDELQGEIGDVRRGGYLRLYVYRPRADQSFFAILKLDR